MKSSQSLSEPAATAKHAPYCAFPNCKVPPTNTCSRCLETKYYSKDHQIAHWKWYKKICVAPQKKISAPLRPSDSPLKGPVNEEEEDEDKSIICLDNVVNAKLRPKKIAGFDVGKWQSSIGEQGLWPRSLKNLSELASGQDFNEYFQKQFNGNEVTYLRWKEVFDVLEIGNAIDVGPDLQLEQQVLRITNSEDLVKLRALAKLCSRGFFEDSSLLVAVERRILEVLVLAMLPVVEKKARGKKKQQQRKKYDPRKMEILDACFALGRACNLVGDFEDARRYYERAKDGCEEQLGRDSEKALEVTFSLICATSWSSQDERIEKFRDLLKRMERALGEENVVTLMTLHSLGFEVKDNGEYEEAIKVYERCLAGIMKVLGEDHKGTLMSLNNLGAVYYRLKNFQKAMEYYERALQGTRRCWGRIICRR